MQINKRKSLIISALFIFALILSTLFLIFSFAHPSLNLTKASGFSQKNLKKQSNKLRFVVPDTIDTTKTTYISIKKEWFESSGLGKITEIKAKPGKYLALDFTDRQYDSEVFTIYTKNWFGVKKQHDVIVDYSNFLRVFFPESYDGAIPRKPIILPYSKLESDYRTKLEDLRRYDSFFAYDKKGLVTTTAVRSEEVFNKQNAQGRAFIVNNNTRISLVYDFVLPGIFKNQTQKTQVYEQVEKAVGKAKTYDPVSQGLEIKFNTPPFYITKFLGWYYTDPAGNRVDLLPGQEFQIPGWVKSELRLIAKYEMTTDTSKLGPALDKQGLVSVSYFDGPERVFFDIVKKGTLLKERVYAKLGYAYQGWYTDPELTNKVYFKKATADTHTVLYLKSTKRPETPAQTHTVNFITRTHANQLLPLTVKHGEKLDSNYLLPTTVSYLDSEGDLYELDYWHLVDPITGTKTKFDFSTPITEDITLEAVLKKRQIPNSKYTIKRYFESLEHPGEFIEDISKQEVVIGQVPGQEVELLPHQYRAPEGFNLLNSTVLKKTIERNGTTTFELKYLRNRYTVTYEVNYNGNHFAGVTTSDQPSQTVLYEGKATKPTTPSLTKLGYTYTFKHWQLKDEMGNSYRETTEFDFENTKITKNLTLVAYFVEQANHVLPVLNNAVGEIKPEIKQATVDTSLTIDENNANPAYLAGFEPIANSETKNIEADGSTVFTINYRRRKFTVTYEVNYNGNHFNATPSLQDPETVEYEGTATKPSNPTLTRIGYTYTFKHWQIKDEMGNVYKQVAEFDFNTKITKNFTLVAYFEEQANPVNYTINHVLPGLNNAVGETKPEINQATADTSLTVSETNANPAYLAGFEPIVGSETKNIEADGSTVFTINYRRRKFTVTYEVNYNGNHFPANPSLQDPETVEYEGTATKPSDPTLTRIGYTYTFKHWQLKDEMAYEQAAEFDFENTKITKNTTLVAYFEEQANLVNYTINHVLPGLNNAVGEIKPEIKQATADTSLTVSETNANPAYLAGFEPIANSETKNIEADGSTVFTINYRRRKFTVTYEVNYLNHFEGTPSVQNSETVEYEANATQPPMPTITKHGRTYTFKHWQLKDETGNSYNLATSFDFNTKITKNTELVAYFEETIDRVNYKVVHYLEKTGEDSALNGQYDKIEEVKQDQKVEEGAVYHDYSALDSNLYEKDTAHPNNLLNSQLTTGDNTTEVRQYYKLREINVKFEKTEGIDSFKTAETIMVKKTRKITLPEFNLKDTYNFVGWSLSQNGQIQSKFIAGDENIKIYAQTELQNRVITYTVKTQKTDGSYTVNTETKSEKIGINHTVSYANPDSTVYQNPVYSVDNLTVSADETQNKVTVTINRKTYTVAYLVQGHSSSIPDKTFLHGALHGEIDESKYQADGLSIYILELDNNRKTKEEIKNLVVINNHTIKVYVGAPTSRYVGKYPQTKVTNTSGILEEKQEKHQLNFNSRGKNYTMEFTRHYYRDNLGNRYEKYKGEFYKFEYVEFVKIPERNTWFTKRIIDFSPFNIYYGDYADNKKPERSIFKAMVEDIGKVLGAEVHMPTYDSGDFSVKPALDANLNYQLKKESTDYAKATLGSYHGQNLGNYRGTDLSPFVESGHRMPIYFALLHKNWWLGTQYDHSRSPYAYRLGGKLFFSYSSVEYVLGVVVCIR